MAILSNIQPTLLFNQYVAYLGSHKGEYKGSTRRVRGEYEGSKRGVRGEYEGSTRGVRGEYEGSTRGVRGERTESPKLPRRGETKTYHKKNY